LLFAIAAVIFTGTGVIGKLISFKTTLTMGKFLMIATFVMLGCIFILSLLSVFGVMPGTRFMYIYYVLVGILFIGYMLYDFSIISKMDSFALASDSHVKFNITLMMGFKLLIDFVGLL
jgi:FtsH-binding integral membrane protein